MKEIENLESQAAADGFWDDMEKSQKILQRTKEYKNKVQRYNDLLSLFDVAGYVFQHLDVAEVFGYAFNAYHLPSTSFRSAL